MIAHPLTDDPHQDPEQVRKFFDQWSIYRKIVDHDYLYHHDAYAAVAGVLATFDRPISFLDLGAGDADATSKALANRPVKFYQAVDLSEIALRLAEENQRGLACEKRFVQADFFEYVGTHGETYDVVFIGLSLHHLPLADKRKFMADLRRMVAPGGCLMFYEPISNPGESRAATLDRWWTVASQWNKLTETELTQAKEHVFGNDYPETISDYERIAHEAGFGAMNVPFISHDRLYAIFAFQAP